VGPDGSGLPLSELTPFEAELCKAFAHISTLEGWANVRDVQEFCQGLRDSRDRREVALRKSAKAKNEPYLNKGALPIALEDVPHAANIFALRPAKLTKTMQEVEGLYLDHSGPAGLYFGYAGGPRGGAGLGSPQLQQQQQQQQQQKQQQQQQQQQVKQSQQQSQHQEQQQPQQQAQQQEVAVSDEKELCWPEEGALYPLYRAMDELYGNDPEKQLGILQGGKFPEECVKWSSWRL